MRSRKTAGRIIAACLAVSAISGVPATLGTGSDVSFAAEKSSKTTKSVVKINGTAINNISNNNYTTWAKVVTSYLAENSDGTLTKVQYTGSNVAVDIYDKSYKLKSTKKISCELPIFGGFYSGKDANFLVFGQDNTAESKTTEVIRIVKYSKDWKRLGECKLTNINTVNPFAAGSLRMTETNGQLYVYTCHKMNKTSDGLNHQANLSFLIDESTMNVKDSFYKVGNIGIGYASHSFNEFIETDGEYFYRVDHGDAHLRAVSIIRSKVTDPITSVEYKSLLDIQGKEGANQTGVSVGGLALSSKNCITVGNTVDQSSASTYNANGVRNIFVSVASKDLSTTKTIYLTKYTSNSGVTVRTPQIVKVSDNKFVVMWEEMKNNAITTRLVSIDGSGKTTSDIYSAPIRLSDCQPFVASDGLMKWYVSDGSNTNLYKVDPNDLGNIVLTGLGDVDGDGLITAYDASITLTEYTLLSSNKPGTFDERQYANADANGDGLIGADDASYILTFYTYLSGNPTITDMEEWIAPYLKK